MVPFLAGLSAKDLCPVDRCDLAHPTLLLRGGRSAHSRASPTHSYIASNLAARLNLHRDSDVTADLDPSTHLHPDQHAHTSAGTECHLHLYATPCADIDTYAHRYPDRFPHLDDHALTDIDPHTHSHAHPDPHPDPYLDTDTYPDAHARPHIHLYPNWNHHNNRNSATTLIRSVAISNERIP